MNTCSINIYIYIYIYNLTLTQNTQLQSQSQEEKKKKNTNHHKTTNKGSKPINPIKIKIKTTILVITHTTKSTN